MPASDLTLHESPAACAAAGCGAPVPPGSLPPADFKRLFESLPVLILVLDPGLRIVTATDAYLEATLTRRDDIVGCHLFDVFPDNPDDLSADSIRNTRASMQRVLQSHVPDTMLVQRHDVRRPASEGGGFEVRYWSPVNSPVLNEDGSLAFIIHRVENVTEFVQMKQHGVEREKMTDALYERSMQMEADLYSRSREVAEANAGFKRANEELARLYAKTRELDDLKTRFFANVSHELRTPLSLILGPLNCLLQDGERDDDARRNLQVVHRNALLLRRQVNDLLDLAKLEAGRMQLAYARTDLARLVRFAASYFQSAALDRHVRLDVAAPAVLIVEADAAKVERMLVNLLSNAFKFTPHGGAIAVALSPASDRVRIEVADNGPGIPAPLREAVFERFGQGDNGTERCYGGSGLGLAIVREFAVLHGGSARLEDAPGSGALFVVELPLKAPAGTSLAGPATVTGDESARLALAELAGPGPLRPAPSVAAEAAHILVVEDNPDLNAFVAQALARHYRVTCAHDGREGLDKALAHPPDLILADVMMPRMSGECMVEELRRYRAFDDVPVVILSAVEDEAQRVRLLRRHVQDFLPKPFSVDEVLARVGGLLAQRQRDRSRLQRSEERFRATFEQAAVGLAHVAPDGRWLRVNRTLCEIVGYAHDELLARSFQEITYPDDLDADLGLMRQLLAGEIPHYSLDKRYLHKNGSPVWVRLTGTLVRDEVAQPDYFIAVVEDIRKRKDAEAEVLRLNARLERRVEERTVELQAANRELDSFATAVSHDLRAPLRAMRGFSDALIDDFGAQLPTDARQYIEQIRQGGQRMGELIDGLLALSRATLAELHQDEIDLSAMATAILAELAQTDPQRQVAIAVERGLAVRGDARMLNAVMRNLIGNAWKYTLHTPRPAIGVSAQRRDGVEFICVVDNGAGFDMACANRLFQPFQRLHRHEDFPGTGVGLATVQRIVQRHGGTLDAQGEPGRGARFCFNLPRRG